MHTQLTRQVISTIFFAGSFLLAHAQVMITPQIPPTGLIKKDQLWNIVLVNNNDIPYDVQIQVSVQDIKTGEKIEAEVDAESEASAARLLSERGLTPIEIKKKQAKSVNFAFLHRIPTKEKVIFSP